MFYAQLLFALLAFLIVIITGYFVNAYFGNDQYSNTGMEACESGNTKEGAGRMEITFPYEGDMVKFGEGWLEQTDSEDYRWVEHDSILYIDISDLTVLCVEGFIPDSIDINKMEIYVNDKVVFRNKVSAGEGISVKCTIGGALVDGID